MLLGDLPPVVVDMSLILCGATCRTGGLVHDIRELVVFLCRVERKSFLNKTPGLLEEIIRASVYRHFLAR